MKFSQDIHLTLSVEAPSDWDTLLQSDSDADFFHSSIWVTSVCRHFSGMKAVFLEARVEGKLVGGMVAFQHRSSGAGGLAARLDSGYDGTSGGPLSCVDLPLSQQEEIFDLLLSKFLGLRSRLFGICTISLNQGHELRFGHLLKKHSEFSCRVINGAAVDLAGGSEEVSARKMGKNKRNERNRGLKRGVEIVISHDPVLLAEYYSIYQKASDHWGIPPVPLPFLRDLLVSSGGQVFFTATLLEGKVIGGHLNLHLGSRVIAWNGVTDPAFARSHFPATLCLWGDIEESCRRGARWLDLGASGGVVSLEGFKKNFGAAIEKRALYVNESFLFSFLRRVRIFAQSVQEKTTSAAEKDSSSERWHDKIKRSPEKPTPEDG